PYVLKYGPVLGAVVNIAVRMPEPRSHPGISTKALYGFETNWNGQREYISVSGGNRRIFFRAGGGFIGYGSYRSGDGRVVPASFRKAYGDAGLGWKIGNDHTFRVGYFFNQGEDARFPALPMDEKIDQTHLAIVQYNAKPLGKHLTGIDVGAYGSHVHHVMDNLRKPTAATMQAVTTVDAYTAGLRAAGSFNAGQGRLTAGFDIGYVQKDGEKVMTMKMIMAGDTFVSVKHTHVWDDARILNSGCYGEYSLDLNGWGLTAALRADLNRATSGDTFRLIAGEKEYFGDQRSTFLTMSFSVGVKKELTNRLTFRAAMGKGTRNPSLLERFIRLMPVRFDSYDYLGNPQLHPEHNYQADAGLEAAGAPIGTFSAGGFFSVICGYIHGVVVPPSVIKPSTQGAPGVKQFSNAGLALLRGFELSYRSPSSEKWDLQITAAATWGSLPEATRYLLTSGQVTGEETIKNDPLAEIPPLEGTLRAGYRFLHGNLIPTVTLRLVAAQNRVSQAYRESATPGFVTVGAGVTYSPCRFAILSVAVTNLFDSPYYEHLNRRIVGSTEKLYDPGRVFQFTITLKYD
ncbi:MAG TPA: TonB-dependent receptor, partial [Bacteroidales bacterium]|nr:TonB-dependent receptor [Bacteroidales bacterium]